MNLQRSGAGAGLAGLKEYGCGLRDGEVPGGLLAVAGAFLGPPHDDLYCVRAIRA
ncbi:hypothetical protein OTB20_30885 [Streptomyces sp. H27-H1]|uniref:hypothetical protein n=1 Tax=Streptomyces sp. H27-H1 TaxID=2996461 RepID=UPI0022710AA8|nr:hypothetical protein [Streptomyces sp. H27-H1]MCY0930518.1 hypothetical protein [Streptomyces sp. H27-H1]